MFDVSTQLYLGVQIRGGGPNPLADMDRGADPLTFFEL